MQTIFDNTIKQTTPPKKEIKKPTPQTFILSILPNYSPEKVNRYIISLNLLQHMQSHLELWSQGMS